ncbi:hypothetical protein ACNKHS_01265 [Shigella flexneri]
MSANMILPLSAGRAAADAGSRWITEESRAVLDFLLMLCSVGTTIPVWTDIHSAKTR